MLEVQDLTVRYGAVTAIRGVSISVHKGEVVTLIGANGAGKTTLVKAISGLVPKAEGTVTFRDKAISREAAHRIAGMGLVHVPEGRKLVPNMTVEENLRCGAYCRDDREGIEADLQKIVERFPRLKERYSQHAATMSGGERQMLAIGRALMARPELLILDEPSLGLAPLMVDQVFEIVREFKAEGKTILLIEQSAMEALACSDRGYVMRVGEIAMEGRASDLLADKDLRQAYLGMH